MMIIQITTADHALFMVKIAKFLIRKDKENHFVETRDYPGSRGSFRKYLACSQTVYFLLKVQRARVIKIETVEN